MQTRYPVGRIVTSAPVVSIPRWAHQSSEVYFWLTAQAAQTPLIELDVSWLAVGHVDELVHFVPSDKTALGFTVVVPDPKAALDELKGAPRGALLGLGPSSKVISGTISSAKRNGITDLSQTFSAALVGSTVRLISTPAGSTPLPEDQRIATVRKVIHAGNTLVVDRTWATPPPKGTRFVVVTDPLRDDYGRPAVLSAGEVLDGSASTLFGGRKTPLLALNKRLASAEIPKLVLTLVAELGLQPSELVRVPVLFKGEIRGGKVVEADTLLPNPVNMVTLENHVIVPDPFGLRIGRVDRFKVATEDALLAHGVFATFIDAWSYHLNYGAIHCGTNVRRTRITRKWWEALPP